MSIEHELETAMASFLTSAAAAVAQAPTVLCNQSTTDGKDKEAIFFLSLKSVSSSVFLSPF